MKIRAYYRDGLAVDFVVPENILMVDFIAIAVVHGQIKTIEFL